MSLLKELRNTFIDIYTNALNNPVNLMKTFTESLCEAHNAGFKTPYWGLYKQGTNLTESESITPFCVAQTDKQVKDNERGIFEGRIYEKKYNVSGIAEFVGDIDKGRVVFAKRYLENEKKLSEEERKQSTAIRDLFIPEDKKIPIGESLNPFIIEYSAKFDKNKRMYIGKWSFNPARIISTKTSGRFALFRESLDGDGIPNNEYWAMGLCNVLD